MFKTGDKKHKTTLVFAVNLVLLCGLFAPTVLAVTRISSDLHSSLVYNNNIFKLEDEQAAERQLGSKSMGDTLWRIGAGVDADIDYQHQSARFHLGWDQNRYSEFDFLNNDSKTISTRWRGRVGGPLIGVIDYQYRSELADYADIQQAIDFRYIRQQNSIAAELQMEHGARWRFKGALRSAGTYYRQEYFRHPEDGQLAQTHSQWSNRDVFTGNLSVDFIRSEQREISIVAASSRQSFPDRSLDSVNLIDNEAQVYDVYSRLNWALGGRSGIDARLGMRYRDYRHFDQRNIGGIVGNLRLIWAPTGKYRFSVFYRHDKDAVDYSGADYANIDEIGLSSELQLLHNLLFKIAGSARQHVFAGEQIANPNRSDFVGVGKFELLYVLRERMKTSAFLMLDSRTSEIQNDNNRYNYESAIIGLNLTLVF